jgi:lycopene beta-cyclase
MVVSSSLTETYDYVFLGCGAANSLLMLQMHTSGLLAQKRIAVVEPDKKITNDRTFCFWITAEQEQELGIAHLIDHRWHEVEITGIAKERIDPMAYCHIEGIRIYNEAREIAQRYDIHYFNSAITNDQIEEVNGNYIFQLNNTRLCARLVFDSRPPVFAKPKNNESYLLQSFVGWKIRTSDPVFDPSAMTMMDFNIEQHDSVQFVYCLPFNSQTALVEVTRFGTSCIHDNEAFPILKHYLSKRHTHYEIESVEKGVIPMSTAALISPEMNTNWIYTGAASGKVKPSTGYAFHAMAEDALHISAHLKNDTLPSRLKAKSRFRMYDRLLLKILEQQPHLGKHIFETLFQKAPVSEVLHFLREKTSLLQDARILLQLPKVPFIKAAVNDVFQRMPVSMIPALLTPLFLVLSLCQLDYLSWGVLMGGFLLIGLPHGALDHLTTGLTHTTTSLVRFILKYLFIAFIVVVCWYLLPDVALLLFILYSAWHFGEADFEEAGLKSGLFSFMWGLSTLLLILFSHPRELSAIVEQLGTTMVHHYLLSMSGYTHFIVSTVAAFSMTYAAVRLKRLPMAFTVIYLCIAAALPLLMCFGLYFICQHSLNGWRQLKSKLSMNTVSLWKQAAPFTLGALVILGAVLFFAGPKFIGLFFILLSAMSLPHVWCMHRFYTTR